MTPEEMQVAFDNAIVEYEAGRYEDSCDLFLPLAKLGYVPAHHQLGTLYLNKNFDTENNPHAYMHFCFAAFRGCTESREEKNNLKEQMTDNEIAHADRLITEWDEENPDFPINPQEE